MLFLLFLKRLAVFVFGIGLAYLTIFTVFPLADHQLPLGIAILLTYCFVAYVGLPGLIRFSHLLDKPKHVPTRTHASDGWAVDAINIVVLARSEREFIAAMKEAGWVKADKLTFKNSAREL
ncbi:MAG TPA: LssY C-terminal domain-containing protein, partial [Candidatus Saccharimonadales bacterium]|nr:LssY C-terminal domain-containing protein [Candidatus Saccharimonadales bacterium]